MSTTLFGYFGLGLRALNAAQTGLSVAGDNIANVNTPGFSRRQVRLQTGAPIQLPGGYLDDGVTVASIRRAQDRFLNFSIQRERGGLGNQDELLRRLRAVESVFGSYDDNGIAGALNNFSNRFREIANDGTDLTLRTSALSAAGQLADRIRETYSRLQDEQASQDDAIRQAVGQINSLTTRVAQINRELVGLEAGGNEASGLRDELGQVVEQLSELTGGNVEGGGNGRLRFSLPGGPTLVTAERALPLTTVSGPGGALQIVTADGSDVTGEIRSGRLGAVLEVRDDVIAGQLKELDRLAGVIARRANSIVGAATDLNGDPGGPLFDPGPSSLFASGYGGQIKVSQALLDDPSLLAVSTDGSIGDTSAALTIGEIATTGFPLFGNRSPTDYFANILASLGNAVVEADVGAGVATELVNELQARRGELTGVSLDEEAVELVRYQRAYESAARFIATLNEVTEIAVRLGT